MTARSEMTLGEIIAAIVPGSPEASFFDVLDEELRKVELFFKNRERDAVIHATVLQRQLKELKDHRKLFYVSRRLAYDSLDLAHLVARKSFRPHVNHGLLQLTFGGLLGTCFHHTTTSEGGPRTIRAGKMPS